MFRRRAINYILHVLTKYPVHLKKIYQKQKHTKKCLLSASFFSIAMGFPSKGNMWQYFLKSFISYNNFDNDTDYFFSEQIRNSIFSTKGFLCNGSIKKYILFFTKEIQIDHKSLFHSKRMCFKKSTRTVTFEISLSYVNIVVFSCTLLIKLFQIFFLK